MSVAREVALYQRFLPEADQSRAHVWKFSWEFGGRRPRHFHAEPELNLVVAGYATFGIGDLVVKASAGELIGFPPGQDHALLETSPDVYLFAIGLEPRFSAQILHENAPAVAQPIHARPPQSDFRMLQRRAEAIVDCDGVDQLGAELWEHANWMRTNGTGRIGGSPHVLTRRTLAMLSRLPEVGRDVLAQELGANPTAISRCFHQDLGITLVKYRARQRLLRFIRNSGNDLTNLARIARAVGFGSYSQCHRVFQAELGCSPRDFFFGGLREQMQTVYEE